MTMVSIGYGDITAGPFNQVEQLVAVFLMLLTCMIWSYLVGVFCSLAIESPQVQAFRTSMTQLNSFMLEHQVTPSKRSASSGTD
jgi:hypothetical protein